MIYFSVIIIVLTKSVEDVSEDARNEVLGNRFLDHGALFVEAKRVIYVFFDAQRLVAVALAYGLIHRLLESHRELPGGLSSIDAIDLHVRSHTLSI